MSGWNGMGSDPDDIADERNLLTSVMTISQLNIDDDFQDFVKTRYHFRHNWYRTRASKVLSLTGFHHFETLLSDLLFHLR
jgi:hypothetical protein